MVQPSDSIVPSPSRGQCYLAHCTLAMATNLAPLGLETLPLESCHAETRHTQAAAPQPYTHQLQGVPNIIVTLRMGLSPIEISQMARSFTFTREMRYKKWLLNLH